MQFKSDNKLKYEQVQWVKFLLRVENQLNFTCIYLCFLQEYTKITVCGHIVTNHMPYLRCQLGVCILLDKTYKYSKSEI